MGGVRPPNVSPIGSLYSCWISSAPVAVPPEGRVWAAAPKISAEAQACAAPSEYPLEGVDVKSCGSYCLMACWNTFMAGLLDANHGKSGTGPTTPLSAGADCSAWVNPFPPW